MLSFSLQYMDKANRLIEDRRLRAPDVWHAMACANRRLHRSFASSDQSALDPQGRVDVLDPTGAIVARIYCAEAIAAMS